MAESTVWVVSWRDEARGYFVSCDLKQDGAERFHNWVIRHGGRDVQIIERVTISRVTTADRSQAS